MVVEAKAGLESPTICHHKQQLQAWLKWHTKPVTLCFWKVISALDMESTRLVSPLQKLAIKFRQLGDSSILKRFDAYIQPPWVSNPTCIILPQDQAIRSAKPLSSPAIFTDISARNSLVGIGIHSPNIAHFPVSSTTVASTHMLNVFIGELLAIDVVLA